MPDLSLRAARLFLRLNVKRKLAQAKDFATAARALDLRLPYEAPPQGFRAERLGGVAGEWALSGSSQTLLYLHGGAYFAGTARSYRSLTSYFARLGFDVFTPSYRLAPRHPFPAALDDVRAVYTALAQRGGAPLLAGDSAGGGLALALLMMLRDAQNCVLPAAAALFSPWTNLAVTGASTRDLEASDPLFTRRLLKIGARGYLAGAKPDNPLASPLYGDLGGLPPILIHVGAEELLLDDSLTLARRARAAGTEVTLVTWPGVPHGWQLGSFMLGEARDSLREAANFLRVRRQYIAD